MSSAFYPLGSNTYNNRLPQGGYKSWKGKGIIDGNPIGTTAGTLILFLHSPEGPKSN